MTNHCSKCHEDGILHHFAPPKALKSVWAWEMSVRFVAQELLVDSLNRVGLPKEAFLPMVQDGDDGSVKFQVGGVLGGAICCSKDVDKGVGRKLIGRNYHGLYVPEGVSLNELPTVEALGKMRDNARDEVVRKAREWLRKDLLVEMQNFDYTTLVTAFKNAKQVEKKKSVIAGYIWNAFGLFFTRGVVGRSEFPPAAKSLSMAEELDSTMWDEFARSWSVSFQEEGQAE